LLSISPPMFGPPPCLQIRCRLENRSSISGDHRKKGRVCGIQIHEKGYLSAFQNRAQAPPRLPRPYGHKGWTQGNRGTQVARTYASFSLSAWKGRKPAGASRKLLPCCVKGRIF